VVTCVAFSRGGKSLAASDGQSVRLWDPATGQGKLLYKHEPKDKDKGDRPSVLALAFTPDGETLIASESDGTLRFWEAATSKETRTVSRPGNGAVTALTGALAVSPDGKTIASAGVAGDIELWETATGKSLTAAGEGPGRISVACSADGKEIVTGSREGLVCLWDASTGRERARLGKGATSNLAIALSVDGKIVATCGEDGAVRLWKVSTPKEIRTLPVPPRPPSAKGKPRHLRFSPDGKTLAVGCTRRDGDTVQLCEVASGKAGRELPLSAGLAGLAFSPDGKLLATAAGATVRTWSVPEGSPVREYGTGTGTGAGTGGGLAFSPNGRLLAAVGSDGVISLFDVATRQALRHLAGHDSAVHALAFSPDGRLLASGGDDALVGLWEAATGRAVSRFLGHAGPVRWVTFLPDGRGILSAGDDGTALLWDVTGRTAGAPRPAPPGAAEQRRLWEDLAGFESPRAYQAIWRLADNPEQGVPLLYDGLKPVLGVDAQRIERLIAQLDHNRFIMREKASAALQSLGNLAEPALRRAMAKKNNPEVARRVEELLSRLKTNPRSAEQEQLRRLRALTALEQSATAEARKVLREVERGAADEELRQAARDALRRLADPGS
jgi:WD40 repeat protein